MKWIKRNLPLVLCIAAIVISLLAMVISAAISARAQKPEPRKPNTSGNCKFKTVDGKNWYCDDDALPRAEPEEINKLSQQPRQINDNEVLGVKVDRQRTVLFVVPPDFWAQVEQHCVAVLTEKHDENLPISFSKGNAVAHIPEQTLKLRCQ